VLCFSLTGRIDLYMTLALSWEQAPPMQEVVARPTAQQLCDLYTERVYRFAAMIGRSSQEAEDIAQDALERAIRGLHTFDPNRGELERWLFRIVVNAARDAGRVAKRRQMVWDRLVSLRPSEGAEAMDIADTLADETILAAVRSLRPRDRALIALRFGADLDFATVGAHMGLTAAAAQVATGRALVQLRRVMEAAESS
jgi:RNA polymerase sigma-70 factor (ECF subfamily)